MSLFRRREGDNSAVEPKLPFPVGAAPPAAAAPTPASAAAAPPSPHTPLRRKLPWQFRFTAYATAAAVLGLGLWLGVMMVYYTVAFPNPLAVRGKERAPVIRIVARDGTLLADRGAAHDYMPIDMMPKHVIDAVVATEDRRFFRHFGIDPAGLARAAFANLRAGRFAQGGSTLTQQLAKNLFLTSERTMSRKLDELALALWLEVRLSKREILELYLNRVYFGGGAYGVEAAAQRYFDKSARALSLSEAALIAGLLKAPSKYSPTSSEAAALSRGRSVLAKMRDAGLVSSADHAAAQHEKVKFAAIKGPRATTGFEYVIDLVFEKLPPVLGDEHAEMIVETTIDAGLQRRANELVQTYLSGKGKSLDAGQAALVTLDGEGGIRALVGGRSYADSQFNRATKARRQPGSVFKPFVYLTALERGIKPDTVTYDLPLTIGGWSPRNDNNQHVGALTVRQALAQSVNTVAVRLSSDVGLGAVAETARRLGVKSELREDPSMALGTSELTLLELTGAYGVLANGGTEVEPHVIRRVRLNTGRVLYARAGQRKTTVAALPSVGAMNDMLNAALVAGTGRRAALPRHPAAGKTGTTQDFRDAWFIGYTAHMTTGVWIGNDDGAPMRKVMGGNLPAEIWREVMIEAHRAIAPASLPGTTSAEAIASSSPLPPVARADTPESLPWLAPKPPVTSSTIERQPRSRSLAAVKAAKGAPTSVPVPGRPEGILAASKAGSPSVRPRVFGQRVIVEPPKLATASGAKTTAPIHPEERISADFLARALAAPTEAGTTVAGGAGSFDPEAIRRQLDSLPVARSDAATPPQGIMSLGAAN